MSVSVKEYITSNLKRGVSWDKIRESLVSVGHKEEYVDEIYKNLKQRNFYKKASMVLLVIIILGLGFLIYSYVTANNTPIIDVEPVINEKPAVVEEPEPMVIKTQTEVYENLKENPNSQHTDNDLFSLAISSGDVEFCNQIIDEEMKRACLNYLGGNSQ